MAGVKHSARVLVRGECCGFPVTRRNCYVMFQTLEIQQASYELPRIEIAAKWRKEAPRNFEFALRAWQRITHEPTSPTYRCLKLEISEAKAWRYGSFRPTAEVTGMWEQIRRFGRELGAALVVSQCPEGFAPTRRNKKNMMRFFKAPKR